MFQSYQNKPKNGSQPSILGAADYSVREQNVFHTKKLINFIKSMKEYQENFFTRINFIQFEVLFLKMPALGSHHSLHHGPKHLADIVNVVLGNGGPLLLHGGLQGVGVLVRVLVGLALSIAPGGMVEGQADGRGQGPEVGHHAQRLSSQCQQGLKDQFGGHGGCPGQAF